MKTIIGVVILLHGLVHFWYVVLSQSWVEFQADMAWTGESWLLSSFISSGSTSMIAALLYSIGAAAFVIASLGYFTNQSWTRAWMIFASIISAATILIFWDGKSGMLVEKGVIGFAISLVILVAFLVTK